MADGVISKENAFTFVQNEKTFVLALVLAECFVIVAPTSGIIWILILGKGLFLDTMDC